MMYYFLPLEEHPDYGYGMLGVIYKNSSDDLAKSDNFKKDWHSVIPVNYLRRHSIELFLKSGIILFHKKFLINFDNDSCNSEPKVKLRNGEWECIKKTHNIGELYEYLIQLIFNNMDFLNKNTSTIWDFDKKFKTWIDKINGYDSVSDYFRYPITSDINKDKRKNVFHKNTFDGIQKDMKNGKKLIALIVEDKEGEVRSIYNNSSKMEDVYNSLEKASDELMGFHTAVRAELFNNY